MTEYVGKVKSVTTEFVTIVPSNGFEAKFFCWDEKLRQILISARAEDKLVTVTVENAAVIVRVAMEE